MEVCGWCEICTNKLDVGNSCFPFSSWDFHVTCCRCCFSSYSFPLSPLFFFSCLENQKIGKCDVSVVKKIVIWFSFHMQSTKVVNGGLDSWGQYFYFIFHFDRSFLIAICSLTRRNGGSRERRKVSYVIAQLESPSTKRACARDSGAWLLREFFGDFEARMSISALQL